MTFDSRQYYATRLVANPSRESLWRVLCRYLQADVGVNGTVMELGGGYCHFINHIRAREKHVLDVYEGTREFATNGVQVHIQPCSELSDFETNHFDTVFASNLFEHLTRDELNSTLRGIHRIIRPGGRLLIIQPNFKDAYREYFDDYTHLLVFTDMSLCDLLVAHNFHIRKVFPRFLPFSLKSGRTPKPAWLLALYLKLPVKFLGGQMYIVAEVVK